MNDDTIKDLKQFMSAEISGQLSLQNTELKREIISEVKNEIKQLETNLAQRIDDLETKLDTSLNHIGIQLTDNKASLSNHENRILKLERTFPINA